jgi:hypothetical protein
VVIMTNETSGTPRSSWRLAAELCVGLDNLANVVVLPGTDDALVGLERVAGTCAQAIAASRTDPALAELIPRFGAALGETAARWAGVETIDPNEVLTLSADVMAALDRVATARTALARRLDESVA